MQVKFQENQIIHKENMGYHWTRKNRSEGTQLRWHRSRKVKIISSDCFLTYDLMTAVQNHFWIIIIYLPIAHQLKYLPTSTANEREYLQNKFREKK